MATAKRLARLLVPRHGDERDLGRGQEQTGGEDERNGAHMAVYRQNLTAARVGE